MKVKVFLDASCLMAALGSSKGGSHKLLEIMRESKHILYTSEIAIEETKRHIDRVRSTKGKLAIMVRRYKVEVLDAPNINDVEKCYKLVIDKEDAYLIASSYVCDCHYLVSLDKRHVLTLTNKVKRPKIVSPKEMIEILEGEK